MLKLYLAHPISGLSYEQILDYYTKVEMILVYYFEILCPMTAKGFLRNELKFRAEGYGNPVATNHAIFERDQWMVRSSDIVYVNFENAIEVSTGCVMELAWASAFGKHTVITLPKNNPHRHAFVLEAADIVFEEHDKAIEYLTMLANGEK